MINCGGNNRGVTNEVSVLAWVKTSELTKGQWIAGKYNGFLGVGDRGYLLTIGDENNFDKIATFMPEEWGRSVQHWDY